MPKTNQYTAESNRAKEAGQLDCRVRRGFPVQKKLCSTCIFRRGSPLDLNKLLDDIADPYGGFKGYRICHHSDKACCAGFWAKHKNDFPMGQIAQRLGMVEFVCDDRFNKP